MSDPAITERTAIDAAMHQDWEEAIRINTVLLKSDKSNINILNRLGFAYLQNGQMTEAKKTFLKVTKLDTYNQIAVKNLKKLNAVRQKDIIKSPKSKLAPENFLEEPGKTKIVECINAAPMATLSTVSPGEEVLLHARNHAVEIRNLQNMYLAALPDDLSFRLIKFLAGGNTYKANVKAIGKNSVIIFIRELSRGKHFLTQPSFASTGVYMPMSDFPKTSAEKSTGAHEEEKENEEES